MGWFGPSSSSHHRSNSHYGRNSHHSSSRSSFMGGSVGRSPSLFGLGGGGSSSSRRHHGGSSSYGRRPRDGYIQRLMHRLRLYLRDLLHYARRHPIKVFFFVIMPLISGGVLHRFARQFGIRLPAALQGSGGRRGHSRGGYYGSEGYGGGGGFASGLSSMAGGLGGVSSAMKIARQFM